MPLLIEFNAKDKETIPKECATWQNLIFFHMNFLHIYIYIFIFFFFFLRMKTTSFIKISRDQQKVHHIGVVEYPPPTLTNL